MENALLHTLKSWRTLYKSLGESSSGVWTFQKVFKVAVELSDVEGFDPSIVTEQDLMGIDENLLIGIMHLTIFMPNSGKLAKKFTEK